MDLHSDADIPGLHAEAEKALAITRKYQVSTQDAELIRSLHARITTAKRLLQERDRIRSRTVTARFGFTRIESYAPDRVADAWQKATPDMVMVVNSTVGVRGVPDADLPPIGMPVLVWELLPETRGSRVIESPEANQFFVVSADGRNYLVPYFVLQVKNRAEAPTITRNLREPRPSDKVISAKHPRLPLRELEFLAFNKVIPDTLGRRVDKAKTRFEDCKGRSWEAFNAQEAATQRQAIPWHTKEARIELLAEQQSRQEQRCEAQLEVALRPVNKEYEKLLTAAAQRIAPRLPELLPPTTPK